MGALIQRRSSMMPRAATTLWPVCQSSLLTTKTRLSRVADNLRHASLSKIVGARFLVSGREDGHVDRGGAGRRKVRIARQVVVGATRLDIGLVGKPLRRRPI